MSKTANIPALSVVQTPGTSTYTLSVNKTGEVLFRGPYGGGLLAAMSKAFGLPDRKRNLNMRPSGDWIYDVYDADSGEVLARDVSLADAGEMMILAGAGHGC